MQWIASIIQHYKDAPTSMKVVIVGIFFCLFSYFILGVGTFYYDKFNNKEAHFHGLHNEIKPDTFTKILTEKVIVYVPDTNFKDNIEHLTVKDNGIGLVKTKIYNDQRSTTINKPKLFTLQYKDQLIGRINDLSYKTKITRVAIGATQYCNPDAVNDLLLYLESKGFPKDVPVSNMPQPKRFKGVQVLTDSTFLGGAISIIMGEPI